MEKVPEADAHAGALPENEKTQVSSSDSATVEDGTYIKEAAMLRKLDLRVLPALTSLYLLSFLDRSNGNLKCLLHTNETSI